MIVDLVIVSLTAFSIISGFINGIIVSFTSFFGLIIAALVSNAYLEDLYIELVQFFKIDNFPLDISENYYIYVSSYILLMFLVYMVIYLFAIALKLFFRGLMLGWLDRFLGAIFGLVKGIIISSMFLSLLIFVGKFNKYPNELIKDSKLIAIVPDFNNLVYQFLPPEIYQIAFKGA